MWLHVVSSMNNVIHNLSRLTHFMGNVYDFDQSKFQCFVQLIYKAT